MLSRQVTIMCDRCADWFIHYSSLAKAANRQALDLGWAVVNTRQGKKHYCSKCKETLK